LEGHLYEIAKNTGSTRDLLDLRKQTFGGGRLGAIGVTASELATTGTNPTNAGAAGTTPQPLSPPPTTPERSIRKMIIQPDQTVKVVFNETMSNGISLDEITRRIRSNTAIAAGGAHFMIVMRTNPLYVERSAKSSGDPTNVAYNIIAESGFLNYKVSNIKKTYSAHVPRRGDVNQPWQNCLGMAQTTSIILPRYEYASGAFLNSTGTTVGTEGQYTMPLVTPNAVQYGGIKD